MTTENIVSSQLKASKVAGYIFLFILFGYIIYGTIVLPKFTVTETIISMANNLIANELQVRIGLAYEIIASICAIVLSLALYIILKPINKILALLALLLKLTESIIVTVKVLISLIALQMLNGKTKLTAFEPEKLQDLVGLFLNVSTSGSMISMVFLGLGFMLFFYLLCRSKYVPGILAGFGILSYFLILIYGFLNILAPNHATNLIIQIICMAPSCLFELSIGLWLLIKGVNIQN
jgi:hypothetical protein